MRLNKEHYKYPILLGWQSSDHQVAVWCPYCVEYHYHGIGEGHRIPHCSNPQSPFAKSGYIVKFPNQNQKNYKNGTRKMPDYYPTETHYPTISNEEQN